MKGTEKQIKWAEDIKASVIRAFEAMERNAERDIDGILKLGYNKNDVEAVKAVILQQVEAIDDAGMIINLRERLTQKFFEQMAQMHNKEGR